MLQMYLKKTTIAILFNILTRIRHYFSQKKSTEYLLTFFLKNRKKNVNFVCLKKIATFNFRFGKTAKE
jgi:hypothetical protein